MPFDWYHVRSTASAGARARQGSLDAQRREVRERASLLMRLGRSKADAAARCRQNLRWQYELRGESPVLGEVDGLVDEVYGRTLTLDPRSTE